jgi:hypothetical protein
MLFDDWRSVIQYFFVSSTLVGLTTRMILSEICGLISVGRPLWCQDGSAICSVITQWSESLRTRNHTLLSHQRHHEPGGSGSHIYIPQEQGGLLIPPGIAFPLRRLLRLARLRWKYSNPAPSSRAMSSHIYSSGTRWSSPKSKPNVEVKSHITLLPIANQTVCLGTLSTRH